MKKALLLTALSLLVCGCHPTPEPSSAAPETPESAADPAPAQSPEPQTAPVREAVVGTEWGFFYKERRDEASLDIYKRALKLVKDQTGTSGTLSTVSRHIGDWYLMIIEIEDNTPRDMIPTDAPPPDTERAYLVDMAAEKVVQTGDILAARPFYRGLHLDRHVPSVDPDVESSYLGSIAASLSAVNFGHTRYIEPIQGQRFPDGVGGPRLSAGPNGALFTYYISGRGMMYSITECKLRVSDTAYEFTSDIFQPKEAQ